MRPTKPDQTLATARNCSVVRDPNPLCDNRETTSRATARAILSAITFGWRIGCLLRLAKPGANGLQPLGQLALLASIHRAVIFAFDPQIVLCGDGVRAVVRI